MQPYTSPTSAETPEPPRRRVGLGALLAGVLLHPRRFFLSLSDLDIRVPDVVFYAVLLGLEYATTVAVLESAKGESPFIAALVVFAIGALTSAAQLYVTAGLVHLAARTLGGSAPFASTRRALAFASAPVIFVAVPLVGWIAAIWALVLQIVAIASVHRIGAVRAALAYVSQVALAIAFALTLRILFIEAYKIPSGGMYPTLLARDHLFITKDPLRWFRHSAPERGALAVFEYPDPDPTHTREDFVKRAIALSGDVLEVDHGEPIINGWRVPRCHVGTLPAGPELGDDPSELYVEFLSGTAYLVALTTREYESEERQGPYTVPAGEFYVLGDNRNNSMDSRAWNQGRGGGVPLANYHGRARWLWFPRERAGISLTGNTPALPDPTDPTLSAGLARCLAQAPPPARTIPPPAPASTSNGP